MTPTQSAGSAAEVFRTFLRLGLTSFGGPIAHLGYFREEFVQRRGWMDEAQFAQLLAVCQFLPGPTSSQLGFAIGLLRADWRGALAAFAGFTLPSAVLMFGLVAIAPMLDGDVGSAIVHGLKLVAVVVVAHGLLGMLRQLTPDLPRALIAAAATALMVLTGEAWMQLVAIAAGAVLGSWLCRHAQAPAVAMFPIRYGRRVAAACLLVFLVGLVAAVALPASGPPTAVGVAAAFYRAGALVFGGGHVVLPLLQQSVVDSGWLRPDTFLAGYGAAQAVPGPMFSLAAFLGAEVPLAAPAIVGGSMALAALFLPGFLLVLAVLPAWAHLARHRSTVRAMAGINAAVVGLLAAALHDPLWTQGVLDPSDFVIAVVGFALLAAARASALWIVLWCVVAKLAVGWLG